MEMPATLDDSPESKVTRQIDDMELERVGHSCALDKHGQ
jgi:hypothetical protein